MNALLILGNQLFSPELIKKKFKPDVVFMREDFELCSYFKFHKHKIIFTLTAMRNCAEEFREKGIEVHFEELQRSDLSYEQHLVKFLKTRKINHLHVFEIEDKFFEKRILSAVKSTQTALTILDSPLFLTTRADFKDYLSQSKKPFMRTFYERQRKALKILIDKNQHPIGGKWSFDQENRLPLPLDVIPPLLPSPIVSLQVIKVSKLCDTYFKSHPGEAKDFWLPTTRSEARSWLSTFIEERLENFGPFEDAIPHHSDFVFHSILTPFLNTGLLTANEVVREVLDFSERKNLSIQSIEGFIRQVIGWREFIHGIYQNFSDIQEASNFWNHTNKLSAQWYTGSTSIPPLDAVLKKVIKYGYAHHIERLMILGSLMLLLEISPTDAHRWFMEMFLDSSDWVMGPNVFGMALFSDGGIFATKPYICGSNYYRKMGGYRKGAWCDGVDGLYWQFIEKHKSFFLKNPRLSMMARSVEKINPSRKKLIFKEAQKLRQLLTISG
jgi:deoxyribodipyrimidine photolyase-related protein